jgi:thiosulfate/3-mercaptopyruvate sulfurtransferase
MKHPIQIIPAILICLFISQTVTAQNPPNWKEDQLMKPSKLAEMIRENKKVPVIINVGPSPVIPGSTDVGMVKDAENLTKLKDQLSKTAKDATIVVYCGCCPFEHCPNVRPAIDLLKEMNFTNYKLLDLPHNIKVDWIDKGYPTTN